jgi:hypothetical protein
VTHQRCWRSTEFTDLVSRSYDGTEKIGETEKRRNGDEVLRFLRSTPFLRVTLSGGRPAAAYRIGSRNTGHIFRTPTRSGPDGNQMPTRFTIRFLDLKRNLPRVNTAINPKSLQRNGDEGVGDRRLIARDEAEAGA